MDQVNNFSKFGKTFQEDLWHLMLNDRTFADQMFEVLDLNFLELKHLRVFTRKVKEYREKYGVHPTSNIMHSIIRTGLDSEPESVKVRIREYFARGFEAYFLYKDLKILANISPILYNRIETLADME